MKKLFLYSVVLFLSACGLEEHEPFQEPFVHIMKDGASSAVVSASANTPASRPDSYSVYLSSAPLKDNLEVTFDLVVGDGLEEGRDFVMVTQGRTLTFFPGIYDVPIRIRWIARPVDPAKDNTLTIVLLDNSKGFNMGLPGPDHLQSSFVIRKQ
ncbi:MAG: hypothetical protein PHQ26_09400 [Bacteroidales bacterium]|nr:hypothetical protein [Bacteroidales bacterium]